MSRICVQGVGVVSPAGWGLAAFRDALSHGEPIPSKDLARPGWDAPLRVRQTPPASPRPSFMAHARLRRTSPIAQFVVSSALEALGDDAARVSQGLRLGIVFCAMSGCVNYSRRFYDEVLKDPSTASPLVFPETVYNSPASHLASLLGTTEINYTLVGDPGVFLQGVALAAEWLSSGRVEGCLVVGAEEMDWLLADAMHLFEPETIVSDGAGALYLRLDSKSSGVRLDAICSPQLFRSSANRTVAAGAVRRELLPCHSPGELLCDGLTSTSKSDQDEQQAWSDWNGPRVSVKKVFGEAFMAGAAWQCAAAVDALQRNQYRAATVSVVGCNQQAIAARFIQEQTQ